MSDAAETALVALPDTARLLPFAKRRRDAVLPVVVLSLIVHAMMLLPLLFPMTKTANAVATETPVEIIQEPAPQAKKAEPKASAKEDAEDKAAQEKARQEKAKAEKADQAKQEQAEKEQAKAERQAKDEQAKNEQAKNEQAKAKPPEKEPPKPVAKQDPPKPQPSTEQTKQAEAQARVAERMRNLLGQPPPSLDAAALPGESANGTEGASYQQLVLSKLTKALGFDRHRGRPGFCVVTFVLDDHGGVASVTLDRPSGDPILDEEAVAVVKRGSPYPVPPPGGKRDYTVTLESRAVL